MTVKYHVTKRNQTVTIKDIALQTEEFYLSVQYHDPEWRILSRGQQRLHFCNEPEAVWSAY